MSVIRRLSSSVLRLVSGEPKHLLVSGEPKHLLVSGELFTRVLTIHGENDTRYNISYTCTYDAPLAVEYIVAEQIGRTNASTFSELINYYEIAVAKRLSRRYHKNYNISLRFIEVVP